MTPPTIKSTFFLLIITLVFSSYGLVHVEAGIWSEVGERVIGSGIKVLTHVINKGFEKAGPGVVQMTGEKLARKFFGAGGEKGFRWGWKGSKYYLKVAKSCEEYKQQLLPYCIPGSNYNLRPNCVAKCVVVTATSAARIITAECKDSCDDDYPAEAKCNETLSDIQCKSLINE